MSRSSSSTDELDPGAKLLRDLEAPLQRRVLLVSTRRDRVQELQRGGVEPALICRERLDVPAHQLAQDALERCERQAAQPPERAGSFEKRPLRADRPELLGLAAAAREPVHPVFGAEVAVAAVRPPHAAAPRSSRTPTPGQSGCLPPRRNCRHRAGAAFRQSGPGSPSRSRFSRIARRCARIVFCSESFEITVE